MGARSEVIVGPFAVTLFVAKTLGMPLVPVMTPESLNGGVWEMTNLVKLPCICCQKKSNKGLEKFYGPFSDIFEYALSLSLVSSFGFFFPSLSYRSVSYCFCGGKMGYTGLYAWKQFWLLSNHLACSDIAA
jgi:hypothetical protein